MLRPSPRPLCAPILPSAFLAWTWQVPQLRCYLRPASIRSATLAQWEDELPPFTTEYNRKDEPVSLIDRFETYCKNRRNKRSSLKRTALPVDADRKDFGMDRKHAASWSVDFVDLTVLGPKERRKAEARSEWLRSLSADQLVKVKQEPDNAAKVQAPCKEVPTAQPPLETIVAPVPFATVVPQVVPQKAPQNRFTGANRRQPLGVVAPQKPSTKAAAQVKTTKAVGATAKEANAAERSVLGRSAQAGGGDLSGDSSDEEISKTTGAAPAPHKPAAQAGGETSGDSSEEEENMPNLRKATTAKDAAAPPRQRTIKKKSTVQTKLKPLKLKPGEILTTHELFSKATVGPPLSKANAGGRFVLAPASQWATLAQENSGGFVGKVMKVVHSTAQLQFADGKVWFSWDVVSQFKPLS